MYVIFPAEDVVELTLARPANNTRNPCTCNCHLQQQRFSLESSRSANSAASGLSSPPANHIQQSKNNNKKQNNKKPKGKVVKNTMKMATNSNEPSFKDLTHPSLNEQLKTYNTATFKLVKTVSDFNQELSRAYEDHATNLQQLVSNFKKKSIELRKERPTYSSPMYHTWETLLKEVDEDAQAQSEIASVLTRQVSRPLLDRSFHRKVQARKIFGHRESFEIIISKAEEKLSKCRQEYKNAYLAHLASPNTQATYSNYLDAHNTYVRQLCATNSMLEQYNKDTLPLLLQELEEVYTDLCSNVSESVLQGAEIITSKSSEQIKRYENITTQCHSTLPTSEVTNFIKYLLPLPTQPHPTHRLRVFTHPQPPNDVESSTQDYNQENSIQLLPKNELVIDHLSYSEVKDKHDTLRMEAVKLETQIKQTQDSLDALLKIQQRSLESALFNKVNELQEDISLKRYDLKIGQIQLASIKAQRDLFASKIEAAEINLRERKLSSSSTVSMKSKWLKAFKSLKSSSPTNEKNPPIGKDVEKKNEMYHAVSTIIAMRKDGKEGFQINKTSDLVHQFQEYTYKRITPCDVCSQVLRGHTRQGLKCRLCKLNVHLDCQQNVTTKCQTKSRLLRRQKSTSEIETRIVGRLQDEEATSLPNTSADHSPGSVSPSPTARRVSFKMHKPTVYSRQNSPRLGRREDSTSNETEYATQLELPTEPPRKSLNTNRAAQSTLTVVAPSTASSSDGRRLAQRPPTTADTVRKRRLFSGVRSFTVFGGGRSHGRSISLPETPHSPRRHRINWRMKSVSLDSSEPPEFCTAKRNNATGSHSSVEPHSSHSSSSRIHSPSSPIHNNRRLLTTRPMRMSSVELPDHNHEKSPSSTGNSPSLSPVKPQRLLPTNLYVVLYNFKARHSDELDLKAGYKVTVIDNTDQDWWKGKCLGRVGYFPSKYVTRLLPGERVLQVTHNLQVAAANHTDKGLTLLRDQIVIQIGDGVIDGMIMFRNGDNKQGVCPLEFLQEV